MKKYLIPFFIGIVLFISCFSCIYFFGKKQLNSGSFISRLATHFFDFNTISVNHIDRKIESDVSTFSENNCIYQNGKTQNGIANKYGRNCFDIYYQQQKTKICHFKKNNWYVNHYHFEITHFLDSLDVELKIIGPDSSANVQYKIENG